MTDTGALQAMLDAFDNAKQGLGIWDENDNLLGDGVNIAARLEALAQSLSLIHI